MGLQQAEHDFPGLKPSGRPRPLRQSLSSRARGQGGPPLPPPCCGPRQGPQALKAKGSFLTPCPRTPAWKREEELSPDSPTSGLASLSKTPPRRPRRLVFIFTEPVPDTLFCLQECPGLTGFCGRGLPADQGILSSHTPLLQEAAPVQSLGRGPGWERQAQSRGEKSIPDST